MNEGKLPHYRIGRRVRVRRSDFEAFTGGPRPKPPAQTIWDGLLIEASLPDISDPASQCPRTGVRARSRRERALASAAEVSLARGCQEQGTDLSAASSSERTKARDGWLWQYNHHRKHSALGRQPPITRLSNLLGSYSY